MNELPKYQKLTPKKLYKEVNPVILDTKEDMIAYSCVIPEQFRTSLTTIIIDFPVNRFRSILKNLKEKCKNESANTELVSSTKRVQLIKADLVKSKVNTWLRQRQVCYKF